MKNPVLPPLAHPSQQEVDDFVRNADERDNTAVAAFLDKYPSAVDRKNGAGFTALKAAAEWGYIDTVDLLLKNGADINAKSSVNIGRTPLMLAARFGRRDMVEFLLERGADINGKDAAGETALDVARAHNMAEVVAILENEIGKREQRQMKETHKRFLEETDFSKGLKNPIRAPRPLIPRKGG